MRSSDLKVATGTGSVSAGELELISDNGTACLRRTGGQFEYRVSAQAQRDPRSRHLRPDLQNCFLLRQKQHIDGEFHSKGMYAFTGDDPQPLTRPETDAAEQTATPCAARSCRIDR